MLRRGHNEGQRQTNKNSRKIKVCTLKGLKYFPTQKSGNIDGIMYMKTG